MSHKIETEMRSLEKIEQDQMRNILQVKTGIQVPLHLMYLDLGQTPARYLMYRFKMTFLQYILQQEKEILLFKMLHTQQSRPVRGDWFSDVRHIMQELNIIMKIEDIQKISRIQFKKLTKIRCKEAEFSELILKKRKEA